MSVLRIDFCDFGGGFNKADNFFINTLRQSHQVELSDRPDYLIFAHAGHQYRLHDCTKIFYSDENLTPDYRDYDYAMTCRLNDDPRHLRLPNYVVAFQPEEIMRKPGEAEALLKAKSKFCAFIVSNPSAGKGRLRTEFFHRLGRYKHIDSAGRHLNNMGGKTVGGGYPGKIAFLRDYKFNLCFENESAPGYTTEKLYNAMQAGCLPIYWGNPRIGDEFNPKAFLNYLEFPDEESFVRKIEEIDRNDDLYLSYLREPCFRDGKPNLYFSRERFLDFFDKILSTPIKPASRRRRHFFGRWILVKRNRPS
jgi:hypothetical protein